MKLEFVGIAEIKLASLKGLKLLRRTMAQGWAPRRRTQGACMYVLEKPLATAAPFLPPKHGGPRVENLLKALTRVPKGTAPS